MIRQEPIDPNLCQPQIKLIYNNSFDNVFNKYLQKHMKDYTYIEHCITIINILTYERLVTLKNKILEYQRIFGYLLFEEKKCTKICMFGGYSERMSD